MDPRLLASLAICALTLWWVRKTRQEHAVPSEINRVRVVRVSKMCHAHAKRVAAQIMRDCEDDQFRRNAALEILSRRSREPR
jgi:hypothetical protein